MKDGKVENCSKMKDRCGMLAVRKDDVRENLRENYEDLFDVDTKELVVVNINMYLCI